MDTEPDPDWTTETPAREDCCREVRELHEFFVAYYTGECPEHEFERVERALAPGFEMAGPDGDRVDREQVLSWIEGKRGTYDAGAFDIEIRGCERLSAGPGFALVRYEEWQTAPDGETGRLSSALLRPDDDAPAGLRWVALQETWLEE
jgi:hypothetical protein